MSAVRELLGEITVAPALLARIDDEDDLLRNGVNSGDLIRLVVELEERYGLAVDADDLDGLKTLGDFERLAHRQLAVHGPSPALSQQGKAGQSCQEPSR